MPLRYRYIAKEGEFDEAMRELYSPIAVAGSAAIAEASSDIKAEGRAAIARAGFSKRWENAFRAIEYPGGGKVSANAAAFIYHKIPYAEIFESGGTIRGKPLLWIPLSTSTERLGGKHISPKSFNKSIGPLTFLPGKRGRPPLLAAPAMLGPAEAKKARPSPSIRSFRRGAIGSHGKRGPRTVLRMIPLFIGKRSVDMPKKFALLKIIERHAGRLADLYVKHLKVE